MQDLKSRLKISQQNGIKLNQEVMRLIRKIYEINNREDLQEILEDTEEQEKTLGELLQDETNKPSRRNPSRKCAAQQTVTNWQQQQQNKKKKALNC